MVNGVISYFARNGRITALLMIFTILAGVLGLASLRRETFPPVDFATSIITTIYPGASPDEVEDQITLKIEDELRSVDGIKDVRSVSQSGRSEIVVRADLNYHDTDEVMDEVQRAVQRVSDLPASIDDLPRVQRVDTDEIAILELALVGGSVAALDRTRDALADDIQDLLEDVEGVSEVTLNSHREREILILLDQASLLRNNVSKTDVSLSLSRRLTNVPGGYLKTPESERLVRVLGKTFDLREIADVIVRGSFDSGALRVTEVADVADGAAEPAAISRLNGKPATLLTITKRGDADTVDVVDRLLEKIEQIKKTLPKDYAIVEYNNEANRVREKLNIVVWNAATGLVFILIVLLLLLPGTIGAVASLSVPLTILALGAGMALFNLQFNTITMIASVIVIGMLVDNSAVVAEAYGRLRSEGVETIEAATRAAQQFFVPIFATVLCNIAGFAPMLVTSGIMGKFIFAIPVIVTMALAFSMFETFMLLPARLRLTLHKRPPPPPDEDNFDPGWFGKVQHAFQKMMMPLLRHYWLTMAAILAFLVSSIFVTAFLNRFELFQKEQVERYFARFEAPAGSTIENTDQLAAELGRRVGEKLKEKGFVYESILTRAGDSRAEFSDPVGKIGNDAGFLQIIIPLEEAQKQVHEEVLATLRSVKMENVSSLTFEGQANGPPVGKPLDAVLRSTDDAELRKLVDEFKAWAKTVPGVFNVMDDEIKGADEYSLAIRHDLLRRAGVAIEDVGIALRTALEGNIVSTLTEKGREVDVRVRYTLKDRANAASLEGVPIGTPSGQLVRLGSFADVNLTKGPTIKKRFNFQRAIRVSADVDPETITSIELNNKARVWLNERLTKYPLVSYQMGGEDEDTRESVSSLIRALGMSLLGIMGVLLVVYNSFGRSFLVLSTIPLGLAGVSYIFWIAGRPLGFMALIGVIGLGGVVVNASIVLVSFIDDARKAQPHRDLLSIVAEVTALRFKAVFITNMTTIMGLIPTAYGLGGDDPLLIPLTLAMGWGLLIGSAMAILWVPCGYLALEKLKHIARRMFRIAEPAAPV